MLYITLCTSPLRVVGFVFSSMPLHASIHNVHAGCVFSSMPLHASIYNFHDCLTLCFDGVISLGTLHDVAWLLATVLAGEN